MKKQAQGYGIITFNQGQGGAGDLVKLWDEAEDLGNWTIRTSNDSLASRLRSQGYLQGYSGEYTITEAGRKEIVNAIMFEDNALESKKVAAQAPGLFMQSRGFMRCASKTIDAAPEKLKPIIVASRPDTWAKGLMHHRPLETSECALFIFAKEDSHSFWNQNVDFPIDLLYYDAKGRYVGGGSLEAQQRQAVASPANTKYVVEAKRGVSEFTGNRNLWDIIDIESIG